MNNFPCFSLIDYIVKYCYINSAKITFLSSYPLKLTSREFNLTDFKNWQYEHEITMGTDMREPRFLVHRDTLFFYFFEAGKNMLKFEPKRIWSCWSVGQQQWSPKYDLQLDGYVPWRLKTRNDTIYMSSYYGVGTYKNKDQADLRLFVSTDAKHFVPISEQPQITTKNATEAAFEFDAQGHLWGVVRLEGSGSYVVFAHKDSLQHWSYWFSTYKYDSPLLFEHAGEMYLVSRRNVKGPATKTELPTPAQKRNNLIRYSFAKKKTAIFWLDKKNHKLVHIKDFASTGDTAFPGIAKMDENRYYLLNYSSNIHKREKNWITGQLGKTYIYATVLRFHSK